MFNKNLLNPFYVQSFCKYELIFTLETMYLLAMKADYTFFFFLTLLSAQLGKTDSHACDASEYRCVTPSLHDTTICINDWLL